MVEWWAYANGRESGPIAADRVIDLAREHGADGIYVWREGFPDWQPLGAVAELQPQCSATAVFTRKQRFSQKAKWSLGGAVIGLCFGTANLLLGTAATVKLSGLAAVGGFVIGLMLVMTAIGLIAGAIMDAAIRSHARGQSVTDHDEQPHRNLIARHWRGRLPLWISFWAVASGGYLALLACSYLIRSAFVPDSGSHAPSVFAALAMIWLTFVIFFVWLLVGVWRSARRYVGERTRDGRSVFWGGPALMSVLFFTLSLSIVLVRQGWPQLSEVWSIAFLGDPALPAYTIRIMRDGTQVEIAGGIKFGLTDDLVKVLDASPRIKVVRFDSDGGRIGEGAALFKLIRDRGLSTHVSVDCLSACTLAFVGGRERTLGNGAQLGFHRGAVAGTGKNTTDEIQRTVLSRAGIDAKFIDKVLSVPHSGMWKPTFEELRKAGVINAIAEPG
jgi:hypothetical protein